MDERKTAKALDAADKAAADMRKAVRLVKGKVPEELYKRLCADCRDTATALREIRDMLPAAVEFDEDSAKTELDIVRGWME